MRNLFKRNKLGVLLLVNIVVTWLRMRLLYARCCCLGRLGLLLYIALSGDLVIGRMFVLYETKKIKKWRE